MAIKQKEVTIQNEVYMLTSIPGMTGLKLGKQLIKTLGPAFTAAVGEDLSNKMDISKGLQVLTLSSNVRAQRIFEGITFDARLAGAIHFVKISGTVTV